MRGCLGYREAFGCDQLVWQVAAVVPAGNLLDRLLSHRPEAQWGRLVVRSVVRSTDDLLPSV